MKSSQQQKRLLRYKEKYFDFKLLYQQEHLHLLRKHLSFFPKYMRKKEVHNPELQRIVFRKISKYSLIVMRTYTIEKIQHSLFLLFYLLKIVCFIDVYQEVIQSFLESTFVKFPMPNILYKEN